METQATPESNSSQLLSHSRFGIAGAVLCVLIGLAGCSTGRDSATSAMQEPTPSSVAQSGAVTPAGLAVLDSFADAIVAGNADRAFALLTESEQQSIGSAERFQTELLREPSWVGATVDAGGIITVEREAALDPVFGLVPGTARVTIPVATNPSSLSEPKVMWSRRQEEPQREISETGIEAAVTQWAAARQQCKSGAEQQTVNGLVGVVGLADRLCGADGAIDIALVDGRAGDILGLADPASVIDAYGNDAARWARVVPLQSPVAMNVIVAPIGAAWKVIATVHPTPDGS
jgi:hypothetical protein